MPRKAQRTDRAARFTGLPSDYPALLENIKQRIRNAQIRATLSANAELIHLYWDIGRIITERQQQVGWGAAVIPRLARDLRNEVPEVKGFSERNIGYMIRFYREYGPRSILQQPAAKLSDQQQDQSAVVNRGDPLPLLQQLAARLPWFHHVLLIEKLKDLPTRLWYMQQALANGWSRNVAARSALDRQHRSAVRRDPPTTVAGEMILPPRPGPGAIRFRRAESCPDRRPDRENPSDRRRRGRALHGRFPESVPIAHSCHHAGSISRSSHARASRQSSYAAR